MGLDAADHDLIQGDEVRVSGALGGLHSALMGLVELDPELPGVHRADGDHRRARVDQEVGEAVVDGAADPVLAKGIGADHHLGLVHLAVVAGNPLGQPQDVLAALVGHACLGRVCGDEGHPAARLARLHQELAALDANHGVVLKQAHDLDGQGRGGRGDWRDKGENAESPQDVFHGRP